MGKIFPMVVKLKRISFFIILNILSMVLINLIWQSEDISLLNSRNLTTFIVLLFIATIIILNSYILSNVRFPTLEKIGNMTGKHLFVFGSLIHAISLGGSSFVEEEHSNLVFLLGHSSYAIALQLHYKISF